MCCVYHETPNNGQNGKKMFAYIQNPVSKEALFLHSIEYETHQTIHAEKWTSASSMFRLT